MNIPGKYLEITARYLYPFMSRQGQHSGKKTNTTFTVPLGTGYEHAPDQIPQLTAYYRNNMPQNLNL